MTEWTLEKAREDFDKRDAASFARGYTEGHAAGHASRDPEVAALKKELEEQALLNGKGGSREAKLMAEVDSAASLLVEGCAEVERLRLELSAERETVEKLKHEYKYAMAGAEAEAHHADELQAELSAEREASRKLVMAAKNMADQLSQQSDAGERYLTATEIQFREALEPYFSATPGHSPEGKTL